MIGVALLGASGSIGGSTLAVLRQHRDLFRLQAVAVRANWQALLPVIAEFEPEVCAVEDADAAQALAAALSRHHRHVRVESGPDAVTAVASQAGVGIVVAGISGFAGLPSTWAAVVSGKQVLLANKEALVASGSLLLDAARRSGACVLPVDSEHNAVFQCASGLHCERSRVRGITLTASGGPFRTRPLASFDTITPDEACRHPTWSMGRKISVDSATLMNKGLEVIEAALLFDRPAADVHVLIHPTSTVHALVEFVDGSLLAHLGPADMQVPIAHALAQAAQRLAGEHAVAVAHTTGLARLPLDIPSLSLTKLAKLEFFDVEPARFPALGLAYAALRQGQGACLALNAANEVAVAAFLSGAVRYTDIVPVVEATLAASDLSLPTSIDEVFARDRLVRAVASRWIASRVAA